MTQNSPQPSRRDLLKTSVVGAGLTVAGLPSPEVAAAQPGEPGNRPASFDFTAGSAALTPDRVVRSACQFCNSLCGLQVHLRAGQVIDVKGVPEDPVQAGEICVKAELMPQLVYNRFRLTRPLKRVGGA